jgi:hypothetical protein
MAYATAGLRQIMPGAVNIWALDTVDSVATATGSGYVSDGGPTSTLPGRGLQIGDAVLIRVVGALTANGIPPATCTDQAWSFVSAINASTGAATLTLTHTNA